MMKATKYILLFLLIAILGVSFGCKKEEFAKAKIRSENGISGTWNLTHVYGGIAGVDEQYASGEITWKFNSSNLVVNNNSSSSNYYYLPTGTYQYAIIQSGLSTFLSIENSELGQYIISGDDMSINQNMQSTGEGACGFYMELER